MNFGTVTNIFLLFLFLKKIIEAYLDKRNKVHIRTHSGRVPQQFASKISLKEHQKAAQYTITKINTGQFFNLISTVCLFIWTLGGGLAALDTFVRSLGFSAIHTGPLFFGLFALISLIIDLPESLYTTFVVEEKFGFNKTTPRTFVLDILKGMALSILIGGPIIYGILAIMNSLDNWWVYAWVFITAVQLILVWAYPRFIAPLFNKFKELEEGETKKKILSLLLRVGFKSQGLFVMDASRRSSHGNAYFTGFGKNKRIVFFDNLIKSLEPEEVEAVLAHELGHFKRKHILKGMIKSVVFSFIGFFSPRLSR